MPHAIIEYSDNLAAEAQSSGIAKTVHTIMQQCGLFDPEGIKTRAYPAHDFLVGNKGKDGRFIHVTIYLLEGRNIGQKQSLSQSVLDKMSVAVKNVDSITVDVRELVKDVYRKTST